MIVKIPLRQHQPEEIYNFLVAKFNPIKIKIKRGYALITLPSQSAYKNVLEDMGNEKLFGKKLEFSSYTPGQDLTFNEKSQKNDCINLMDEERTQKQPKFNPQNDVDRLIIESHLSFQRKVDEAFERLIHISRDRVNKLNLEIKETDIRNREIKALQDGVKKKLDEVENKSINLTKRVLQFIQSFTTKPSEIQLQPTFKINFDFKFPQISIDNCEFKCDRAFTGSNNFCWKRLCALNRNQFIVSGNEQNFITKGFVKIFDVNQSHHKQAFELQDGASGLAIVNSIITIGNAFGMKLNTINLDDEERTVKDSGILVRKDQRAGSEMIEIKKLSNASSCSKFVTLCKDNVIRVYQTQLQNIFEGCNEYTITQKDSIDAYTRCRSLQVLKDHVIAYGVEDRIIKQNLQSKRKKDISIKGKGFPFRIKRINDNQMAVAIGSIVYIIDNRSDSIVQNFVGVGEQLISIQPITDHCIFFGVNKKIGMLDGRRSQFIRWSDEKSHRGSISDIIKLGERVVSCDVHGNIFSWKLSE